MDRKTFYTSERSEWRKWLSEHFETENEVWFVFPSKDSGEPALSYNDAVEEALCFGWIDGVTGHLDDTHGIRRFTPRKNFSYYSRPNIERLIWLDKHQMIHPKVRPTVVSLIEADYEFPEDILDAIKTDETAWKNYQRFSEPYKRIRVAYIDAARKRPDEFAKRLSSFLAKTRENRLITGFGGINKYYGMEEKSEKPRQTIPSDLFRRACPRPLPDGSCRTPEETCNNPDCQARG